MEKQVSSTLSPRKAYIPSTNKNPQTKNSRPPFPQNPETQIRVLTRCYLLVDLDAHGALGDFPDSAGSALVELGLHAFVDGAIQLEVHVVTFLVGPHVVREGCVPFLPKGASKQISDPRTNTVTSRHFCALA